MIAKVSFVCIVLFVALSYPFIQIFGQKTDSHGVPIIAVYLYCVWFLAILVFYGYIHKIIHYYQKEITKDE